MLYIIQLPRGVKIIYNSVPLLNFPFNVKQMDKMKTRAFMKNQGIPKPPPPHPGKFLASPLDVHVYL